MIDPLRKEDLASALLRIGAVSFSPEKPFTWSSGLRAPVYCDLRLTLGYPELRRQITDGFAGVVEADRDEVDVIAGTATAGIPQAALLADRLERRMVYVRSKPKGHGRKKQVEGLLKPGDHAILVEDLVSTGGSVIKAADALRAEGADVRLVVAVYSYGLPTAERNLEQAGLRLITLTDMRALLQAAERSSKLSKGGILHLNAWRQDPEGWSRDVEARDAV